MKIVFTISLIGMALNMTTAQQPVVLYNLGMSKPSSHLFEVEVRLEQLPADLKDVEFILPVWRPGRYLVLDFASGVQEFEAFDGSGSPLLWSKVDKSLWRVAGKGGGTIGIRYKVYANEFNLRTRGLNADHAFVDGASVFMYVERLRDFPVRLRIHPYQDWHVTTGLEGRGEEFSAPNYDYLVDCPIEVGHQKDVSFDVEGLPHVLSIFGEGNWDADTLVRDIKKIVRTEKEFWGEYPYKRYVFMLHLTPSSGGGTEHINSCAMGARPFIFKNPESYRGFLGLVSHEFFHTWNVKQLRPKGIHPYDYTKENYSRELWIAEGTTSYYDDLLLIPAGFKSAEKYLEGVAGNIQNDRLRPGNNVQPLAASSFDAWVKYWRATEQSYNAESDYYSKGANVSLLLDLEIRHRSNNSHSLDDVFRSMFKQFPLSGAGYTTEDFRKTCDEMSGSSMEQFFARYIDGTKPLPWEESLGYAGLQLAAKDSASKPWIGIVTSDVGEKTRITRVVAGSPAYVAGVDIGDEVVALNGNRTRTSELVDRVSEYRVGEEVKLTIFRNDQLREFAVQIGASPVPAYKIAKISKPTDLQKHIYEDWLRTPW